MSSTPPRKPGFFDKLKSDLHSVKKKIASRISRSHSPQLPSATQTEPSMVSAVGPPAEPISTAQENASSASVVVSAGLAGHSPLNAPDASVEQPRASSSPDVTMPTDTSGETPPGRLAKAANVGFEAMKTTLRVVERASTAFPPLQSAVGGLLGVIDVLEKAVQNRQDCEDLERKIAAVVSVVESHSNLASTSLANRLERFLSLIRYQMIVIDSQKDHGHARRAVDSAKDAGAIATAYRALSSAFDIFLVDTSVTIEETTQKILSDSLLRELPRVVNAAYDAVSPAQRNSCTEGTREAILAHLLAWATDQSDTKIYWMNGMAGTGKTTIAYTFSEILHKNSMLGASFFCSRLEVASGSVHRIFPTIAYSLAQRFL